jgi:hypothetical protein
MKDLREAAKAQAANPAAPIHDLLYTQTLYLLARDSVRFYRFAKPNDLLKLKHVIDDEEHFDLAAFDRVVTLNDHGVPFTTHEQSDFGFWNLANHQVLREGKMPNGGAVKAYFHVGLAAIQVVTDEVEDHGLRARNACAQKPGKTCSWLHAQTSRDGKSPRSGATLNKHLHGVRDLFRAAMKLVEIEKLNPGEDHGALEKKLVTASIEGLNHLVYENEAKAKYEAPNFFNFVVMAGGGDPVKRSWLYYGYNTEATKPYFLSAKFKNCGYHIHDYELLDATFALLASQDGKALLSSVGVDASVVGAFFANEPKLGTSIMQLMYDAHIKKTKEGLYKAPDKPLPNGANFDACEKGKIEKRWN